MAIAPDLVRAGTGEQRYYSFAQRQADVHCDGIAANHELALVDVIGIVDDDLLLLEEPSPIALGLPSPRELPVTIELLAWPYATGPCLDSDQPGHLCLSKRQAQ